VSLVLVLIGLDALVGHAKPLAVVTATGPREERLR
jgi:hypothetical protein